MKILVLRSSRLPHFFNAADFLKHKYPAADIWALAQENICSELTEEPRFAEIIPFTAPRYSVSALDNEQINQIRQKHFSFVVITYANISGAGYDNVHDFAESLELPIYIYDKNGGFYKYSAGVKLLRAGKKLWHKGYWSKKIARKINEIKNIIADADRVTDAIIGPEQQKQIKTLREGFSNLAQIANDYIFEADEEERSPEGITVIPSASIIVVNFNGKDLLEECLPSIFRAIEFSGKRHEVIVVDNGSTDGSQEFIRQKFPKVKLISLPNNHGFPKACNKGVEHARHDILVFLNNDLTIEPDFLSQILLHFETYKIFAISAKAYVYGTNDLNQGMTLGVLEEGRIKIKTRDSRRIIPSLYAMGGSCAIDRGKFGKLGGFDEIFTPGYSEDLDLCVRAWRRGWSSVYDPNAIVNHKVSTTTYRLMTPREVNILGERNNFIFTWKNFLEKDVLDEHWRQLATRLDKTLTEKDDSLWLAFNQAAEFLPAIISRRKKEKLKNVFSVKDILTKIQEGT